MKVLLLLTLLSLTVCNNFLDSEEMLGEYSEPLVTKDFEMNKLSYLAVGSNSTDNETDPDPSTPSTFDNLLNSFMKFTNQWSRIVDAFKTTRSSTIKETILGKGFTYFSQSAQIQVTKGIKDEYLDQYLSHIQKRLKVPEERQEDLSLVLEETRFAEKNAWNAFNTLYSIDDGGNTKFCSILVAKNDEKNTYDFMFTDIKADFKLAPDVLVVNKKLSVLGGIWEDEKDERISVPKSITAEDVQMVMNFFYMVAFQGFAQQLGIKIEVPEF